MHAADVHARSVDANLETIAEADKGIARQPLAALDAFQQESGTKGRELQIRRDRRIKIGSNVKRRFHAWPTQGNKKTHRHCRGDGFWINERSKAKRPAHSSRETPPPGVAEYVRGRHGLKYRRLLQAASTGGGGDGIYFFAPLCRLFLYLRVNST